MLQEAAVKRAFTQDDTKLSAPAELLHWSAQLLAEPHG
jgi:hypothetical protein